MSKARNNAKQIAASAVTNEAGDGRVWSVSANKGPLENVLRSVAIDDCIAGDAFTKENVESMLDKGEVAFSDEFYYSTNKDALAKWIVAPVDTVPADDDVADSSDSNEIENEATESESNVLPFAPEASEPEAPASTPADSPVEDGDVVFNLDSGLFGDVADVKGTLKVTWRPDRSVAATKTEKYSPAKWRKATDAEFFTHQSTRDEIVEAPQAPAEEPKASKAKAAKETPAEAPDHAYDLAETAPLAAGDLAFNAEKDQIGAVVEVDGKLKVQYTVDEKVKVNALTSKWIKATEEQVDAFFASEKTAIEKSEPAIVGEIEVPLTEEDLERLARLEAEYDQVDEIERHVPFHKGKILNEIRQGKLYRGTHKTFGDYALARFGITREYAQNLAQISAIPELAAESLDTGVSVEVSVNTANEILRDSNKFTKALGIGKVEMELLTPMLRSSIALMVDVAPKDENGNPELNPKFVAAFNDVLQTHLTDGNVEIDGKQMTIRSAAEQGLLNHSLRSEVLESAAETIKTNAETIRSEFAEAKERQESGVTNGGGDADNAKVYKGKVPTLDVACSKHGETEILSLATGKFQTRCGCRWQMDAAKGELVAYEVDDKRVVR